VPEAQYEALLARALPGTPFAELLWGDISLAQGWALIHAAGILHGEVYIWPDPRLSAIGRTLLRARELRKSRPWLRGIDL
jgi:hypothetical protein